MHKINRLAGLRRAAAFFKMEAAGGIVLMIAALLALIVANTGLYESYDYILNRVAFRIGFSGSHGFDMALNKSLLLWINDGLMVIFFLLVGLEIKREIVAGELSSRAKALLPALAAVGGMAVPALVFWFFNHGNPEHIKGWAIPAATDIAFALAVLALAGSRLPGNLKVLLMAIAVIDDLGAILIIALFYGHGVVMGPLFFAAAALVGLILLNRRGVCHIAPYMLLGFILWLAMLQSGIHATLAGVITALCIPIVRTGPVPCPCQTLEHRLHPWVAFGVLPLFAFANAGVPFTGMSLGDFLHPVTIGIAAGLFFGKQIGIFAVLVLASVTKLAVKPANTGWLQYYGVALLCGIGFTMSLFIGGLAYQGVDLQAHVRMGVLGGSVLSALAGYALLRWSVRHK